MRFPEDSRIVSEVLDGDVNAYAVLVKKYQKPIYNLMYRITGSQDHSLELSQATMVKAYEKLERFDQTRRFFPWLYAIGLNLAKDHLRKNHREINLFKNYKLDNYINEKSDDQFRQVEIKMEVSKVLKAMDKLRFKQKEALILRYKEDLSMKEIAQALSISVSATKMRIHRALKELRQVLRKSAD